MPPDSAHPPAQKIRTFIAISLPPSIVRQLSDVLVPLQSEVLPIKWVRPENLHITMKFLGDIDPSRLDAIQKAMAVTRDPHPLSLTLKGLGGFPTAKRPKVLWTGISGDIETLVAIQNALEENLAAVGFPKEKKKFKGHLTLGRIKGKIDFRKLKSLMALQADFVSDAFTVDHMTMFKSRLTPSGPIYTGLCQVPFSC